jgi:hypothetical protein
MVRKLVIIATLALGACSSSSAGGADLAADAVTDGALSFRDRGGSDQAPSVDVLTDAAGSADHLPSKRALDPYEARFAAHFKPNTDSAKLATLQVSGLGIHCLGAALALQRAAAGADFDSAFMTKIEQALILSADRLVALAPSFKYGWGEGEARDWFADGSTNPADGADGYNTSYAAWCLTEASLALAAVDPQRATSYRDLARARLAAYRSKGGWAGPKDAKQHCADCAMFWYTPHKNDHGRYVKNINMLMATASLALHRHHVDPTADAAGRQSARSQSREIGELGDKNLNYLGRLDPKYDASKQTLNTHNYIESVTLLRAGELIGSGNWICRALRQYRAWSSKVVSTQKTQVAYASCHFARRDAAALKRCDDWLAAGKGLTNLGGVGLLLDYWPQETRSAAALCK